MVRRLTCVPLECITVLLFLVGCTTAPTPRATPRPEPGVGNPAPIDPSRPVNLDASTYMPGQLHYDLQIFSTVHTTTPDSTHRTDSTRLTGVITAILVGGLTRKTVSARVQSDSVSVATGGGTSVSLPLSEPVTFSIDTETGRVEPVDKEVRRDCTIPGAENSPISGREVLPTIHTKASQTWADTVYTSMCRGGAFLIITRIATFTQLQSSDSILRLLRLTQVQITGNGYQWEQKINVSGEGTATDTLLVSGSPLRLQEVSGNSQTKFTFKTPLRAQEFIQTSTTHIALRSH